MFKMGFCKTEPSLSHLRLTVDYPEDFTVVRKIFEELYPTNPEFTLRDIVDFLNMNPEVMNFNKKFAFNEGTFDSLEKDRLFLEKRGLVDEKEA